VGRNDDDLALVARCIDAEPGAWRQLVQRFAPTVQALARRYLRLHAYLPDEAEIEDIVQEVFLALTRKDFRLLKNYDPTYTFKTYLGVITRTQVHRSLRKRRPILGVPDDLELAAPEEGTAVEGAERAEEKDVLMQALEELSERDAEILRLRFLRELDYKAIAEALRIPETSVGQTLFRAKNRLLERLKGILGILV